MQPLSIINLTSGGIKSRFCLNNHLSLMKVAFRLIIACLAIICSFYFVGCNKETTGSYGLPNATQSGAEIFGCLINGTPFIADNDLNDPNYSTSGNGAWLTGDTLKISGAPQVGSYFQGIQLYLIGNLQQDEIYSIDSVNTLAIASTDSSCQGISIYPIGSGASSGTIELTKFDTVNKIVSGNFNLTFPPYSSNCFIEDDTLTVTQGRFDYKYH